ncbi:hypothetical protein FA15DRAFT_666568 [Coprinopsis marcescibilis]|uniref:Uncharacterized protein n=1 Tax=Coprinopsis marcescibilis TaxID=230819 RepID=A0A5C3L2M3_COPMA|nr:hypothetical protein FA15DRAFT_666568 [Coprinopsis marcescibilis]
MPSEQQNFDKVHDPHFHNNGHWVHKEALRVAIGSILTPKRPPFPQGSRSTSGSASPYSLPTSSPHTPGTGTPTHPPFGPSEYLHPHHAFLQNHHHHHTPSRLAHSSSHSPPGGSSDNSSNSSPTLTKPLAGSGIPEPLQLSPPQNENAAPTGAKVKPGARTASGDVTQCRPTVTPLGNGKANSSPADFPVLLHNVEKLVVSASGSSTPRAKFIEKLQSKSAWDALIHGSFS